MTHAWPPSTSHNPSSTRTQRPIDRFDPGWFFLLSGLILLASAIIIPAQADLAHARWQRDQAIAIEHQRQQRLFKHERFLRAVESREPAIVRALAASQLNLVPASHTTIFAQPNPASADASVFPALEPDPIDEPTLHLVDSRLARWARGAQSQLWMIVAGSVLVFVGILPWNGVSTEDPRH